MYFDYSHEFLNEWIDRANSEKEENYLTKFFCYFIAFNYLYNTFAYQNARLWREKDISSIGERKMIRKLIRNRTNEWGDYNPYALLDPDAELREAVRTRYSNDTTSGDDVIETRYNESQKELDKQSVVELFLQIYGVRCNLFHGEKSMIKYRDSKLVKESNIILADFLKRF